MRASAIGTYRPSIHAQPLTKRSGSAMSVFPPLLSPLRAAAHQARAVHRARAAQHRRFVRKRWHLGRAGLFSARWQLPCMGKPMSEYTRREVVRHFVAAAALAFLPAASGVSRAGARKQVSRTEAGQAPTWSLDVDGFFASMKAGLA